MLSIVLAFVIVFSVLYAELYIKLLLVLWRIRLKLPEGGWNLKFVGFSLGFLHLLWNSSNTIYRIATDDPLLAVILSRGGLIRLVIATMVPFAIVGCFLVAYRRLDAALTKLGHGEE